MALTDFQRVTDESLRRLDDIFELAEEFKTLAVNKADELISLVETHLNELAGADFNVADPDVPTLLLAEYDVDTEIIEPDYDTLTPDDPLLVDVHTVSQFSFTDTAYTAQIKTEMKAKFVSVLGDNPIVPVDIWDDIFERAAGKLSDRQVADEWAAQNQAGGFGWELPSEVLLAGLNTVQDKFSGEVIALVVEQAIAEAKERHADIWKAMETGAGWESIWIGDHHKKQDRALEAAKEAVQQAIAINDQIIRSNDSLLRYYGMKWEMPLKAIEAATARFLAKIQYEKMDIESESVRLDFYKAQATFMVETYKANSGLLLEEEKGRVGLIVDRANLGKIIVDAVQAIGNMLAGMTQAALAASDTSVGTASQFGYSEQNNTTRDYNYDCEGNC